MEKTYLVLTMRKLYSDLTKSEMERKVSVLKELSIPYDVFEGYEIKKVVYRKIKI